MHKKQQKQQNALVKKTNIGKCIISFLKKGLLGEFHPLSNILLILDWMQTNLMNVWIQERWLQKLQKTCKMDKMLALVERQDSLLMVSLYLERSHLAYLSK